MKINRSNYETYFLDYIEGTLPHELMAEFEAFLVLNPDLNEELAEFDNTPLSTENYAFINKEQLKRSDFSDTAQISYIDELCISKIEGNLSVQQSDEFNNLVHFNAEVANLYNAYRHVVLEPDKSVFFKHKNQLKHFSFTPVVRRISYALSAAAVVTALYFSMDIFKNIQNMPINTVAVNTYELARYRKPLDIVFPDKSYKTQAENVTNQTFATSNMMTESLNIAGTDKFNLQASFNANNNSEITKLSTGNNFNYYTDEITVTETPSEANTIKEYISNQFKSKVLKSESDKKINFMAIAENLVNGYSEKNGKDVNLKAFYNDNGDLTGWKFKSALIEYQTQTAK